MIANSKRAFCLWALALTILTMLRLCAPAQAQIVRDRAAFGPPVGQWAALPPRPTPTSDLLVFLQPGTNVGRFTREHGLLVRYALRSDPNAYVFRAASPQHAFAAHTMMAQDRRGRPIRTGAPTSKGFLSPPTIPTSTKTRPRRAGPASGTCTTSSRLAWMRA